jgi:GNAT superfamily N-acetyltransferase
VPSVSAPVAVLRAERCTASFFRYLYDTVGERWLWYERRRLSEEALLERIHARGIEIFVLYVGGVPGGFVELDRRDPGETELALFGLVPEFIGRGLGTYFLGWSINQAWRPAGGPNPERVWLHTCSLDHPNALPTYQRAGFTAYRRESIVIEDPRRRPR